MRIRRYPGKAIDASLSLDQGNIMESIYANNWINANEIIKTKSDLHKRYDLITPAATTDGASSLGKYQKTLEQIRNFELEPKDPNVTKTIKELNGYQPSTLRKKNRRQYHDWDEETDQQSAYITATGNGESDSHVPRYEIIPYDQKHRLATTNDGRVKTNATIKRSQTMRDTKSELTKTVAVKDNCLIDKSVQKNDINTAASRRESNTSFNCDNQLKYTTPRVIESDPTNATKYQTFNTKKPVMRAKSVRIHPSVVLYGLFNESDHDGAQIINDLTPSTPITTPVLHSSSSKFNTISVRNNKKNVAHIVANRSPTSKFNQKLTYTDDETKYPRQSATTTDIAQQNNNFYPASAESDETFSIPRPRLIVPVHTYARKRRTGNLRTDHMFTKADADDDDDDDTDVQINGTFTSF